MVSAAEEEKDLTDVGLPVKRAHQFLRQVALSNSNRMVGREILKEVLVENERRFAGCLMLPVTLGFFAFYAVSAVWHEDVPTKHMLEFPVRNSLNPLLGEDEDADTTMLDGLTSKDDVWEYLETSFLPFFIRDEDVFGRPRSEDNRGSFLQYNQVLGGITMSIERGGTRQCQDPLVQHMECFPQNELNGGKYGGDISALFIYPYNESAYWYGNGSESLLECANEGFEIHDTYSCPRNFTDLAATRPEREIDIWTLDRRLAQMKKTMDRRLAQLKAEAAYLMPIQQDPLAVMAGQDQSFKFIFPSTDTAEKSLKRLAYLKDRGWIDEKSTTLHVKATIYNYQLAIPRLLQVKYSFFFSRGGGVYTAGVIEVSALKTFNDKLVLLVDGIFLVLCAISSLFMVQIFLKDMKDGRIIGHFGLSNCISWISIVWGFAHIMLLFGVEVFRKMVYGSILDYFLYKDMYATSIVENMANTLGTFSSIQRVAMTWANLLCMARCFIALQWQPRLAIITATLQNCTSDLFHFLLVLLPTWYGFAVAGLIMFGRRIQAFSHLQSSFAVCLQLALEGEWDWAPWSAEDYFLSLMWIGIYMVLLVMIMMNMVLAIIMDVYAEVRANQGETMTIGAHCQYLFMRAWHYKHWVPDRELWERVAEMPATIVVDELREAYPLMPDYQFQFIVANAVNAAKVIQRKGIDPTYTVQMVAAIHLSLDELLVELKKLKMRGWMGIGVEVQNDVERDCVKEILAGITVQSHWMGQTQKHLNSLYQKLGVKDADISNWKTIRKVDLPPPKVRQGND
mmetsp:Transcript_31176/g.56521  ORF Transcript_31176/g.56521 Transcript_31176/m.56521 type:complete len:793 (+) Transcript_31176:68-2446(+)